MPDHYHSLYDNAFFILDMVREEIVVGQVELEVERVDPEVKSVGGSRLLVR